MPMIAGVELNAKVQGAGFPVLALHGWGGSIASMQMVADRLSGYAVHSLDFPGFGASGLPPQAWGVPDYARCILAYMDYAAIARAHLIGHSFGGRVSLVLGAENADRVGKIVLTSSAGVLSPKSPKTQVRRALGRALKGALTLPGLKAFQPTVQGWYRGRYESEDYRNAGPLRETFVKVVAQDLLPYAKRIKAPTLLIWGDQDQDTPLWQGQALEKAIPDAGLVVFKGAGHFAYQERLADFIRIVQTFFDGK